MKKSAFFFLLAAGFSNGMYAQSSQNSTTIDAAIQELSSAQGSNGVGNGNTHAVGSFVNFHGDKQDTKGSRLLFADWVGGSVINNSNAVVTSDKLLYNYDKVSHQLYLTDKQSVIEVSKDQVKAFTLKDNEGEHAFVRVEAIKPDVYFQVLVEPGAKYGLYSLTKTTLKKADFRTDGMVETGNNYDEYVDTKEYYIAVPGGKEFKKVELKKKSIKDALPPATPQVSAYYSAHKDDDINEAYLKGLILSVNQ
jgi:hypothetical protein